MAISTIIKRIQDVMRQDIGVDGDAQRLGQLGWMLFFKIYSDYDEQLELEDDEYTSPIPDGLLWSQWADEKKLGKHAPTGDKLIEFVDQEFFPRLKELNVSEFPEGLMQQRAGVLQEVFEDAFNYMKSGNLLRKVINIINYDIDFNEAKTRHLFGDIYEQLLKDLQSAGNAGEYYTPRAVTQFAVDMIDPQLGESVLDPACGTGGFLACAYEHMRKQAKTAKDQRLVEQSIHGVEKKPLPYVLCVTNMMTHDIANPSNIERRNTLIKSLSSYGPDDEVDVILTNPPFGGTEEEGIEQGFGEFKTRETADLFLVLVMELLKDGGRAAIVLPDGTLFGEGLKTTLKQKLLSECNLHTIVRLPKGVFAPYTSIKTNVLFFEKGTPTKEIWYYEHPYPPGYKSYSKTKPMRIQEFKPEKAWWTKRKESEHAWKVTLDEVKERGYNLDISNPNAPEDTHEDPDVLLAKYHKATKAAEKARQALMSSLMESLGTGASQIDSKAPTAMSGDKGGAQTRLFGPGGQA